MVYELMTDNQENKNKWVLTTLLVAIVAVVIVFVSIFYMSRPKLVLSDLISYFPETVTISEVETGKKVGSIDDIYEIEQFFVVLDIGKWNSESESKASSNELCESYYALQVNDYRIEPMCIEDEQGHVNIILGENTYHYTMPTEVYDKIIQLIEGYLD